jgi:hypothetical protein
VREITCRYCRASFFLEPSKPAYVDEHPKDDYIDACHKCIKGMEEWKRAGGRVLKPGEEFRQIRLSGDMRRLHRWTHFQCTDCSVAAGQQPGKVRSVKRNGQWVPLELRCCQCGSVRSGTSFVRDPELLPCKGTHENTSSC